MENIIKLLQFYGFPAYELLDETLADLSNIEKEVPLRLRDSLAYSLEELLKSVENLSEITKDIQEL